MGRIAFDKSSVKISFKEVKVNLTLLESLLVINALATKKIQIRGGAWSSIGIFVKQIKATLKRFSVTDGFFCVKKARFLQSKRAGCAFLKCAKKFDNYLLSFLSCFTVFYSKNLSLRARQCLLIREPLKGSPSIFRFSVRRKYFRACLVLLSFLRP